MTQALKVSRSRLQALVAIRDHFIEKQSIHKEVMSGLPWWQRALISHRVMVDEMAMVSIIAYTKSAIITSSLVFRFHYIDGVGGFVVDKFVKIEGKSFDLDDYNEYKKKSWLN